MRQVSFKMTFLLDSTERNSVAAASSCLLRGSVLLSELLKLRNTLAHHLHNSVEKGADLSNLQRLPDILTSRQTCQYCPQKLNCALYERCLFFSAVC